MLKFFPCRAGEMSHFVMVKKTKSLLCRGGQGRGKQLTGALIPGERFLRTYLILGTATNDGM